MTCRISRSAKPNGSWRSSLPRWRPDSTRKASNVSDARKCVKPDSVQNGCSCFLSWLMELSFLQSCLHPFSGIIFFNPLEAFKQRRMYTFSKLCIQEGLRCCAPGHLIFLCYASSSIHSYLGIGKHPLLFWCFSSLSFVVMLLILLRLVIAAWVGCSRGDWCGMLD